MKKQASLIALITLSAGFQLRAQQAYTVEECVRIARGENKEIRMKDAKADEAAQTRRSIRGLFFPSVSASGIAAWNSSGGTRLDIPSSEASIPVFGTDYPISFPGYQGDYKVGGLYYAGVTVQQPLFMGGKIASGYRMSLLGEEAAREQRIITENDVIYETCQAYFLLLKAQQLAEVAALGLETVEELYRSVSLACEKGMAHRSDLMKVEVARNELILSRKRADNGIRLARMNLCVKMGIPSAEIAAIEVPEGFLMPEGDLAIENRPEYRLLEKQVALGREKVITARSEVLPQLGLQGSYGYLRGLNVGDERVLDGGSFTALVNLKIPIWTSGYASHKIAAAKASLAHNELEQEHLAEMMRLEQLQAQGDYEEALLEHQLSQSALELSEENWSLSQKRYEAGAETMSELLQIRTQWHKACEEEVEARCNALLSMLRYAKTGGRLASLFSSLSPQAPQD